LNDAKLDVTCSALARGLASVCIIGLSLAEKLKERLP
jgi:hypothetical protein